VRAGFILGEVVRGVVFPCDEPGVELRAGLQNLQGQQGGERISLYVKLPENTIVRGVVAVVTLTNNLFQFSQSPLELGLF
jgi:hypothetical protein